MVGWRVRYVKRHNLLSRRLPALVGSQIGNKCHTMIGFSVLCLNWSHNVILSVYVANLGKKNTKFLHFLNETLECF